MLLAFFFFLLFLLNLYILLLLFFFFAESTAQAVSSGVRAQSPSSSGVSMVSEKNNSVSHDRKVPVPIGTERSARIRQTGTSTPSVIGNNLATSVGHSGIWSFEGMGGSQGKYVHLPHCRAEFT